MRNDPQAFGRPSLCHPKIEKFGNTHLNLRAKLILQLRTMVRQSVASRSQYIFRRQMNILVDESTNYKLVLYLNYFAISPSFFARVGLSLSVMNDMRVYILLKYYSIIMYSSYPTYPFCLCLLFKSYGILP